LQEFLFLTSVLRERTEPHMGAACEMCKLCDLDWTDSGWCV